MTHTPRSTRMAVLTIIFTVFALSFGDALIKQGTASLSIWQIFTLRSALALPALFVVILIFARSGLHWPRAPLWTALRSACLVAMWLAYYAALPHVDLSIAAAAYYTLPLFITLFAALTTGDRISPRQWLAVALGFAGVLMIIKPVSGGFSAYALLPLLAAMLYAVAMILTGTRCRDEHPMLLSLALNLAFIAAGLAGITLLPGTDWHPSLNPTWATMEASEWRTMTILAIAILIGSLGTAYAYQNGPPALIGTFDFAYVGFSALWGWLIFLERPDALSGLGIALIVVAGLLALRSSAARSSVHASPRHDRPDPLFGQTRKDPGPTEPEP